MEFVVVVLVVVVVSVWLALRVYRFIRGARAPGGARVAPDCSASCPACTEDKKGSSCAELADVGKRVMTNKQGDRG